MEILRAGLIAGNLFKELYFRIQRKNAFGSLVLLTESTNRQYQRIQKFLPYHLLMTGPLIQESTVAKKRDSHQRTFVAEARKSVQTTVPVSNYMKTIEIFVQIWFSFIVSCGMVMELKKIEPSIRVKQFQATKRVGLWDLPSLLLNLPRIIVINDEMWNKNIN